MDRQGNDLTAAHESTAQNDNSYTINRRRFLQLAATTAIGTLAAGCGVSLPTPLPRPRYPLRIANNLRYLEEMNLIEM